MIQFLWGVVAALSAVVALFFFKFWKQTRDALFVGFALGFGLLSLHFTALGLGDPRSEAQPYFFLLRLGAFVCIIGGIVAKNRTSTTSRRSTPGVPPAPR